VCVYVCVFGGCVCLVCVDVCVCVCSLGHPACNVHVPYCYLSLAPLYNISPPYLINGKILEKSYRAQTVCFDLLYNFYSKHFSF